MHIIVLNEGAEPNDVAAAIGATPDYIYTAAIRGFAAKLDEGQLGELSKYPDFAYAEQDQPVFLDTTQPLPGGEPWGLDRIDQHAGPLSSTYTYSADGTGVTAYVLNSGVEATHAEFGGRAALAFDAFSGIGEDCIGHGTHVAGTIGGSTYGVAKNVQLRNVRVFNCAGGGSHASVLTGIHWVTANAPRPAVANMSLAGGYSSAINTAVANLAQSGVFIAVAAGNWATDACLYSPASAPAAFAAAASDRNDLRAPFSICLCSPQEPRLDRGA